MSEDIENQIIESDPVRNWVNWAWYLVLFSFCFFIFFLFTFPYGVVKEAVVAELSQATGYSIRVKDLGPSFLVGVDAEGLKIASADGTSQVELESMEANLSMLSLLIGRATIDVEMISNNKGNLDATLSWGLFQILFSKNKVPQRVELYAKNFEIGGLINLALKNAAKTSNEMVKDMMGKIVFQGNLNGHVEIKLAIDNPIQSTGKVDLQLSKATLDLSDPNLTIAKQAFQKAQIKATLTGGKFTIDNASAFNSQELKMAFKGNSTLRKPVENSALDMGIEVRLEGSLKETFGVILNVLGGNENGLNYKVNGTMGKPLFQAAG